MTLLEVVIAMSIFGVVIGAALMAMAPAIRYEGAVSADIRLHADALRALQQIAADLRQAGTSADLRGDGVPYPHFFAPFDPENGNVPAGPDFDEFNTLPSDGSSPPLHAALPGDADYGATTQIIFAIPTDLDGNGTPTVQSSGGGLSAGDVEWVVNDMTYCLVWNPGLGANELRRYTNYNNNVYGTVAVYVERVFFERNDGSGQVWDDPTLDSSQREIRVTLWYRMPDGESNVPIRGNVSTTVSMRN